MKVLGSIFSQKKLVVRRTTRPQLFVVLTYFFVAEDVRTLEFCYPAWYYYMYCMLSLQSIPQKRRSTQINVLTVGITITH